MHEYVIEGGYPINGTITASGNKNAALPCIAACLLTKEPVILNNIPEIHIQKFVFNSDETATVLYCQVYTL